MGLNTARKIRTVSRKRGRARITVDVYEALPGESESLCTLHLYDPSRAQSWAIICLESQATKAIDNFANGESITPKEVLTYA